MVSPGEIGDTLGNYLTGDLGQLIVKIVWWAIIVILICAVFFAIYLFISYRYKIRIFKCIGDGKGGLWVHKTGSDYARVCKDGQWKLLFRNKKIDPFKDREVYNKRCFGFELHGHIVPGDVLVEDMKITPVDFNLKRKSELELQQLEQDFAKMDGWEANKIFIFTLIGITLVILLAGFVLWLAFKKTDAIIPALDTFTNSLRTYGSISGKG